MDTDGQHINGAEPPWFREPISEDNATVAPAGAVNTAALIETVAGAPEQRVLNSADPDTPSAERSSGQ